MTAFVLAFRLFFSIQEFMSSFEEVYKNALHDDTVAECM
jgi:hypothetical protein